MPNNFAYMVTHW